MMARSEARLQKRFIFLVTVGANENLFNFQMKKMTLKIPYEQIEMISLQDLVSRVKARMPQ
jgi:hypothetical protein